MASISASTLNAMKATPKTLLDSHLMGTTSDIALMADMCRGSEIAPHRLHEYGLGEPQHIAARIDLTANGSLASFAAA